ncbi:MULTISPECIES: hypothetical protein [Candidatus Methylopumilus]|nr:hypothetical protein [Candidatus Methylopumilus universalis]
MTAIRKLRAVLSARQFICNIARPWKIISASIVVSGKMMLL